MVVIKVSNVSDSIIHPQFRKHLRNVLEASNVLFWSQKQECLSVKGISCVKYIDHKIIYSTHKIDFICLPLILNNLYFDLQMTLAFIAGFSGSGIQVR